MNIPWMAERYGLRIASDCLSLRNIALVQANRAAWTQQQRPTVTLSMFGLQIDAKPSVPQGEQQRPRSKKIFVGGLAPDTTEGNLGTNCQHPVSCIAITQPCLSRADHFRSYFEHYGKVEEAQIMVDHQSGRSRGFG